MDSHWDLLLNELRDAEHLKSDAQLAKWLKVSPAFISAIRKQKKAMPVELGRSILERLGRSSDMSLELFAPKRLSFLARTARVRKQAIAAFNERCALCNCPAPFSDADGNPYLEVHHIKAIAEPPIATENLVVALCPNCHAKITVNPSEKDRSRLRRVAIEYGPTWDVSVGKS